MLISAAASAAFATIPAVICPRGYSSSGEYMCSYLPNLDPSAPTPLRQYLAASHGIYDAKIPSLLSKAEGHDSVQARLAARTV